MKYLPISLKVAPFSGAHKQTYTKNHFKTFSFNNIFEETNKQKIKIIS